MIGERARDRVHAEVGDDRVAVAVEGVGALGQRPAVGADVGADRAHRAVEVGDERPLALLGEAVVVGGPVEGRLAAPAAGRAEAELEPVGDLGSARAPGADREVIEEPAVREAGLVGAGGDPRGLRVRTGAPLVGRPVVAAGEPEVVVDVIAPGALRQAAGGLEQIDEAIGLAERIGEPQLGRARGYDPRGQRRGGRPVAGIAGHQRDLVVGVEQRVGVGADPGRGIRVLKRPVADRRPSVHGPLGPWGRVGRRDAAEVDELALVDLHRHLGPVRSLGVIGEGDHAARARPRPAAGPRRR